MVLKMHFLKQMHILKHRILNGKKLPWVTTIKDLDTTITDDVACKLNQDHLENGIQYLSKNNELLQEFDYAHPSINILINRIYNTCFLWITIMRYVFEKFYRQCTETEVL